MVLALNRRKRRKGRRSRKSNPFNGRRARRSLRRYSNRRRRSSNRRRRHRNPAIALGRGAIGRLTTGFKPSVLVDAGLIGAGVLGNAYVRNMVSSYIPQVRVGIPSYLAGLATSGLMLFVPKVGPKLFTGGVVGEIYRAAKENIPQLARLGDYLTANSGVGDYLEAGQLSQYDEEEEGLADYYEEGQATGSGDLATQAASTFE